MEKFFELKERGTDVKTEVMAGITTFMTMAYILAVNPIILGASGMDTGAIFTATALASALATFCMALLANMPFVLSAGMGLNAYFAYTVVIGMGYTWQQALAAIFVEGVIFIFLSLVNIREAIFNAIPPSLKIAVSVGIGLFISFIGLQNAHIVVAGPTLVTLYSFKGSVEGGMFNSEGITVLLALAGLLITAFLLIKNVKGSVLFGIVATWGLGMICQAAGIYVPNPEKGFFSLFPSGIISMPASLEPTL
ncbi:MAG: NCS2 family permease, partial [Selenomonadaceae bacterium]|nr:NCS2 family permease [Selenomonadaceae bacterium]